MNAYSLALVPLSFVVGSLTIWFIALLYRYHIQEQLATRASKFGFIISIVSISVFIAAYPDLFFLSKEMHLPEWAKYLPEPLKPFHAARYALFLFLLPVALLTPFGFKRLGPLLFVVIASPLPAAVIHYKMDMISVLAGWPLSIIWNYAFPLIIVLVVRFPFDVFANDIHN